MWEKVGNAAKSWEEVGNKPTQMGKTALPNRLFPPPPSGPTFPYWVQAPLGAPTASLPVPAFLDFLGSLFMIFMSRFHAHSPCPNTNDSNTRTKFSPVKYSYSHRRFVTTFRASEQPIWGAQLVAGLGSQFRLVRG
jgi:hypothetical protein